MPITLTEKNDGQILEVRASQKLTHADYQQFAATFEAMLKRHPKLRVLFEMIDFHGWEPAVMWDDIKFDLKHFSHIERLAMVGDRAWEKGMSVFTRPFTGAQVRYFDRAAIAQAETWLAS